MTTAVTALFTAALVVVLAAAFLYVGGFIVSMIAAMFAVPIEGILHHRHHPLVS